MAGIDIEVRQKTRRAFYEGWGGYHRKWLGWLATYGKRNVGEGVWSLPGWYGGNNDKAVAAFATLMITYGQDEMAQCRALRRVITESPWEWFTERGFVELGLGKTKWDNLIGGSGRKLWTIARFFGWLWDARKESGEATLQSMVEKVGLEEVSRAVDFPVDSYGIRLLDMMLTGVGMGIGCGLQLKPTIADRCPCNGNMKKFLLMWMPDWQTAFDFDEAVELFGLEKESDFFYARQGWEKLFWEKPLTCKTYARIYYKWYINGEYRKEKVWLKFQPEIDF